MTVSHCRIMVAAWWLMIVACGWRHGLDHAGQTPSNLPESIELASALLHKHPYLLDKTRLATLAAIAQQLRETSVAESSAATEGAKADATAKRIAAETQLSDLLNSCPPVIRIKISEGRATRSINDPVELPGDIGALLFRIEGGQNKHCFFTRELNLTKRVDFHQVIAIAVEPGGTTWALIGLEDMPPGISSLIVTLQGKTGETFHLPLEVKVPPLGRLKASFSSETLDKTMPAMIRLVWKKNGMDRKPGNATEFIPQLDDYGGLTFGTGINGPTSSRIRANLPGRLDGYYWCVPGPFDMALPPGEWEITIRRGIEFIPVIATFVIEPGKILERDYHLRRWVDMPKRGWYSGDDHVHAQILNETDAQKLLAWTKAEDIHVANILLCGDIHRTWFQQRGFGKEYRNKEDDYLLVPGQECPRTDVLGHFLGLNIAGLVRDPNRYYQYDWVYDAIHAQGGLAGYAHGFTGVQGAYVERTLSLNIPRGKCDLLEIMHGIQERQGRLQNTELFYDFLNLGYKITATAGSDAPWIRTIGEARVYAYLGDQPFTADNWFAALRRGRTFVTQGPMVDLQVDQAMPGDEMALEENRTLRVRARAWGHTRGIGLTPMKLEIVRHGEVIRSVVATKPEQQELSLDFEIETGDGCWIAARTAGEHGTWAHTTPVYVIRKGLRFWKHERVADLIAKQITHLQEIEKAIGEAQKKSESGPTSVEDLEFKQLAAQAPALSQSVKEARRTYQELMEMAGRERSLRTY